MPAVWSVWCAVICRATYASGVILVALSTSGISPWQRRPLTHRARRPSIAFLAARPRTMAWIRVADSSLWRFCNAAVFLAVRPLAAMASTLVAACGDVSSSEYE